MPDLGLGPFLHSALHAVSPPPVPRAGHFAGNLSGVRFPARCSQRIERLRREHRHSPGAVRRWDKRSGPGSVDALPRWRVRTVYFVPDVYRLVPNCSLTTGSPGSCQGHSAIIQFQFTFAAYKGPWRCTRDLRDGSGAQNNEQFGATCDECLQEALGAGRIPGPIAPGFGRLPGPAPGRRRRIQPRRFAALPGRATGGRNDPKFRLPAGGRDAGLGR